MNQRLTPLLRPGLALPICRMSPRSICPLAYCLFALCLFSTLSTYAQPELQAWGNLTGLRAKGQLFRFESSLRVVGENWRNERATGRERFWTTYRREGAAQIVRTRMDSLFFTETVRETAPGAVQIAIECDPHEDLKLVGAFFHIRLADKDFAAANVQLIEPAGLNPAEHGGMPSGENEFLRARARGLLIKTEKQEMVIRADETVTILAKTDPKTGNVGLYFTLQSTAFKAGQKINRVFDLEIKGNAEATAAELRLFSDYPGNAFLGVGGNFRLQNIQNDPKVIDYCLENLNVRMGRVELPWQLWHPVDSINPLEAARRGDLHPRVKAAMEMAQRLHKKKMPVLLAVWFPPEWAAEGVVTRDPQHADGTWGNPLRKDRMHAIYASLADYMIYLKEAFGVEVALFSFNEADLGINVRQTPEEHADFIKGFGAYLKSKGLPAKSLLGDTADANGFEFVNAALDDPETREYIGAVSFHSWRGWEKETLLEWFEAADRLDVPLIVGEGSIDAAAWRYPLIFDETHYALEEIKLYVRMLAICQPQAILQWQLTSDYSLLTGDGIFGNDRIPLQPTRRFWNLKQLALTPAGLHVLPMTCSYEELYVAALGDLKQKNYAFHLVNEGPEREVILTGLPKTLKRLQVYTTDHAKNVERGGQLQVQEGVVRFRMGEASFVSLMRE